MSLSSPPSTPPELSRRFQPAGGPTCSHPADARDGDATILLFPGQGSQTLDMREHVERFCPELALAAAELVGEDPFARARHTTACAQPAIFCASIAGWRAAADRLEPAGVVGHSLGEFAALVAAGSLDLYDALGLVVLRGRLMQDLAGAAAGGGMAAVFARTPGDALALADRCGLVVANDNAPHQMVLSGPLAGLEKLLEIAPGVGIRAVRLPVSGAFHSPLMADVIEEFRAAAAGVEVKPPRSLAFCSTTATPFADVRDSLVAGIVRPVLWRQSVQRLHSLGFTRFLEVGPGRALSRLVSAILGDSVYAGMLEEHLPAGAQEGRS